MTSVVGLLEALSRKLDETGPGLSDLDAYYEGRQPLAFLSAEAKEALGNRIRALVTNYPKLAVISLAERLRVVGFTIDGQPAPDIFRAWRDAGMVHGHGAAHVEALALGRAFVMVWGGPDGTPTITVESPKEMAVVRDPLTRKITAAAKRWREDGRARAILFTPGRVYEYVSSSNVPEGGTIPSEGWAHVKNWANPLGRVPVVQLTNPGRLLDLDGVSEMRDILDLTDADAKVCADMLVASEYGSRPRRFVTGMEVQEDEDGNAVNPFGTEAKRVWQSENPDAKFGQFPSADLSGFTSAADLILSKIAAVSGLPAHYLGVVTEAPPSADAIRSAEASLVARCHSRILSFSPSWAEVGSLIAAVQGGASARIEPVWADPEVRTEAQTADAVTKLVQAGIIPSEEALKRLGYGPDEIQNLRAMRMREALDKQITAPPKALPEEPAA